MNYISRFIKSSAWKWLYLGLGVKRWLVLLILGVTILGLGFGYILVQLYRESALPDVFFYLTLQFIPRVERGILFGLLGLGLVVLSIVKLSESLLSAFVGNDTSVIETLYRKRARAKGPRIVVIGGGTGLSTLLVGSHIGLDAGKSNVRARNFVGLDQLQVERAARTLEQVPLGHDPEADAVRDGREAEDLAVELDPVGRAVRADVLDDAEEVHAGDRRRVRVDRRQLVKVDVVDREIAIAVDEVDEALADAVDRGDVELHRERARRNLPPSEI